MVKRWKYRKVTPDMVEEMKMLREEGYTYTAIGKIYNLNPRTVKYWVNEEYRKKCIERAKLSKKTRVLTPAQKERQREYIRKYISERYKTDPEFRERFLKHTKKWQDANRERLREYYREWKRKKRNSEKK